MADLRERVNPGCRKCSNRKIRQQFCTEGLCGHVPSDLDGLPLRCVGRWGQDKTYMLLKYLEIFGPGMKNHWGGKLHYVEICSGPGRLIDYDSGLEFDGTSVAFLRNPAVAHLTDATFIDINETVVDTLQQRVDALGHIRPQVYVSRGDYTDIDSLEVALHHLDGSGLNLLFIDPTDMSIPFSTIAYLTRRLQRADLLINVAMGTDFRRNARRALRGDPVREKYEIFLGSPGFFSRPDVASLLDGPKFNTRMVQAFRSEFQTQLGRLGYGYFDLKTVRHFYGVLFATKHSRGIDFWEKAMRRAPDGQLGLGI